MAGPGQCQEARDAGVDASSLLGPGAAGFILYTFSRGPPTLLLSVGARLFSFSVLFVAPKRFPRPAAIRWPRAALSHATFRWGAETAESPPGHRLGIALK